MEERQRYNLGYNLGGYLLNYGVRSIERSDLLKCKNIKYIGQYIKSGWEEFEYTSNTALRREDVSTNTEEYRYILVSRRSGSRIMLLSYNKEIVSHLIEEDISKVINPPLQSVSIDVDKLVRNITTGLHETTEASDEPSRKYSLSFVHARVPAYGESLRSISIYGDDLADATFFRDNLDLMNFFTCGLRFALGKAEIVRFSNDGSLSFFMSNINRLIEIEEVFGYLKNNGYLSGVE